MASVNDPRPLGLQNPVVYREVALVGSASISDVTDGPTLSVGTGAPTHTRPDGSVYLRKDGDGETSLYQRINGAWVAGSSGGLEVMNDSGVNMTKGMLVYLSSFDTTEGVMEVELADADDPTKQATHVLIADIDDGDTGFVDTITYITGIDTSGIGAVGDPLYLSTGATGGFTDVPPSGDSIIQRVGTASVISATVGAGWFYPGLGLIEGIGTSNLQDGILSADAAGRAKMADDFFNTATVLTHFDADSIDNANADLIFGAAAFAADADSRAIFADDIWTADKLANTLIEDAFAMPVYGVWGVDIDTVETNGGGLCGCSPVITQAGAAFAKVYDLGSTTYSNLALTSALAGFTANYQITADAASEEVGDYALFGNPTIFGEIGFDLSALATWGADGGVWEYWNGAAWVAIPAGTFWDEMDVTDETTGLRSFQQVGAFTFYPPADWAASTIDGQLAYWIRYYISALQVTQTPVANSEQHSVITGLDPFIAPWSGVIDTFHLSDNVGTLHTATDVKFYVMNVTEGTVTSLFTFPQDQRTDTYTGETMAVSEGDELIVFCVQEDGTNEPSGVILTCHGTRS